MFSLTTLAPLAASWSICATVPRDLLETNNPQISDVVSLLLPSSHTPLFADQTWWNWVSEPQDHPPAIKTHGLEKRPLHSNGSKGFDTGWASGCCLGIGSTYNLRQETVCYSGRGGKKGELVTKCHNMIQHVTTNSHYWTASCHWQQRWATIVMHCFSFGQFLQDSWCAIFLANSTRAVCKVR